MLYLPCHRFDTNAPVPQEMKRKFEEILAELPPIDTIRKIFKPLKLHEREPELRLPDGLDPRDPYALFSLFVPDAS